MVMRKLAPLRKKVSILAIGASLGENYILLKDVVRREKLDLEIEFVGIDIDQNSVEMAQELHHGDPFFQFVSRMELIYRNFQTVVSVSFSPTEY